MVITAQQLASKTAHLIYSWQTTTDERIAYVGAGLLVSGDDDWNYILFSALSFPAQFFAINGWYTLISENNKHPMLAPITYVLKADSIFVFKVPKNVSLCHWLHVVHEDISPVAVIS